MLDFPRLASRLPSVLALSGFLWLIVPANASSAPPQVQLAASQEKAERAGLESQLTEITITGTVVGARDTVLADAVVVTSAGGKTVTGKDGSFLLRVVLPRATRSLRITAVSGASQGAMVASALLTAPLAGGQVPVGVLHAQAVVTCQPEWLPTFGTSAPGSAVALAVVDFGAGPALYAAMGVQVWKWTGSTWFAISPLIGGGPVDALATFDDGTGPALYAGGHFVSFAGLNGLHIFRWNGSSWSPVGSGLPNGNQSGLSAWVDGLDVVDYGLGPQLCAIGHFYDLTFQHLHQVAFWDGTSWSGWLTFNGDVHAVTAFDDGSGPALYVGGDFTASLSFLGQNPVPASHVWGASLGALGAGVGASVRALTVFDSGSGPALVAGGSFSTAGGAPANAIAAWDGTNWSPLGSGTGGDVRALSSIDLGAGPLLYAGGSFTVAGGGPGEYIAAWDGSNWSPLGTGVINTVQALTEFDDGNGPTLIAGGLFTSSPAGDSYIAEWGNPPGCGAPVSVCEPGAGGVITCPCGNPPAGSGMGCNNSAATGGAILAASGKSSLANDSLFFATTGELPFAASMVLQGTALQATGLTFGQGVRCVAGSLKRLYVKSAFLGTISAPDSNDPSISSRSAALGDVIPPGFTRMMACTTGIHSCSEVARRRAGST